LSGLAYASLECGSMAGMWRRAWIVALAIAAFFWSVMVIGFIYDPATHRHEPSSDVALILISIALFGFPSEE